MPTISEEKFHWIDSVIMSTLKCGRIPGHVAFIMDGNRRFARQWGLSILKVHRNGFEKMSDVIQWSLHMGIRVVTFYVFNTHNFKRKPEEVKAVMDLMREKFRCMLAEKDKFQKCGLRIRVIGSPSYLPEDLQELAQQVELSTKDNEKSVLHLAFPYSGQGDIVKSLNEALRGLRNKRFEHCDINVGLLSTLLDTSNAEPPEIIIRTGSDMRLSDFLLWQGSFSHLFFLDHLWPEFTIRDFLWAIFKYQHFS